jgi:hypothetical protein
VINNPNQIFWRFALDDCVCEKTGQWIEDGNVSTRTGLIEIKGDIMIDIMRQGRHTRDSYFLYVVMLKPSLCLVEYSEKINSLKPFVA